MAECIALARRGAGHVSPNPLVGCVVVRAGEIAGRGFHHRYGAAHGEVDALRRVRGGTMGSTLYVNLEPCNHTGKTPPCTEAIIAAGVARVVIGADDPNPDVRGGGIRRLRNAGIEVVRGVLREEATEVNKFFFTSSTKKIPYVTVKLAQSLDGKIAAGHGRQTQISGMESQRYVHQLRAEYDAVLVGANTVRVDNPKLSVRHVRGRNPLRVILDSRLSLDYSKLSARNEMSTLVYTSSRSSHIPDIEHKGVLVSTVPSVKGKLDLKSVLVELGARGITSLLVEGGSAVATDFLARRLVDELQLIVAPVFLGGGVDAFGKDVARAAKPKSVRAESLGVDVLLTVTF